MHATSDSPPVDLALVLHFHQPVGNFGEVVDRVIERCYRPLLERLVRHETLRTHLHFNGILLDHFERRAPDLLEMIGALVQRGSCELLGGGHQEPILSAIPEGDAVGQIEALSLELEQRFGVRPAGLWLTERVWEPRLPTPLHRAGMRYTVLDDDLLRWAGVEESGLLGHWLTEDAGHPLALFAGLKALRYTIPFRPVEETFELLGRLLRTDDGRPLVVYADDAEKFGAWPDTHEWVFERGWLERFLQRLEQEEGVETVHLTPRLDARPPEGRVYPPTASYPEMTEWALPTPARRRLATLRTRLEEADPLGAREFVRGGHWRGFLGKYPEADRLHKRMLEVSRRLSGIRRPPGDADVAQATRDLYSGQCNDAYWHGAFGGLYLVHLRRAVERHLIRAERTLDRLDGWPGDGVDTEWRDLDADGRDEIKLRSRHAVFVVDPGAGGCITAWDLRGACENLVTVVQRHAESFHEALRGGARQEEGRDAPTGSESGTSIETIHGPIRVKPGVRAEDLRVDRHPRLASQEWRTAADRLPDPDDLDNRAERLHGAWSSELCGSGEAGGRVVLAYPGAPPLRKTLIPGSTDASIEVEYEAEVGTSPWRLVSEWNLLVGHTGDDLEVELTDGWEAASGGRREHVTSLRFRGGGERALRLECSPAATVSWSLVHTISSSEAGLEKTGQGTAFLVSWPVRDRLEARLKLTPSAPAVGERDT